MPRLRMPFIDEDPASAAAPAGSPQAAPAATGDPILAVHGLTKHWRGRAAPTLDRLDLEMRAGDTVAITGANGAGKTTLLRILGGLVAPDAGRVSLAGLTPDGQRRAYQRRIGLLTPGDRGLYARLTVARHLELWARLALLDSEVRDAAIRSCVERFELAGLGDIRVERLSMGQRQRVRLALVFLHAPQLLLLDEPATSLDTAALGLFRAAAGDFAAQGGMCLAVAPDGADTGLEAPRALILRDGRLEGS
jgi:ABC-2 type transport system ATP-binding protein